MEITSTLAFFKEKGEGLIMAETKKKKETPKIDIYKAWCKACGICVAFCPTGALAKDEAGRPYVKDIEKCINCGCIALLSLQIRDARK